MGAQARIQSGTLYVDFCPMVTGDTRADFETFFATNPEYTQTVLQDYDMSVELMRAQDEEYGYSGNFTSMLDYTEVAFLVGAPPGPIYGVDGPFAAYKVDDAGPFFPVAQVSTIGLCVRSLS